MDVGYFEAWGLWLDQKDISTFNLWGWSIQSWGRAGKLIQLFSGLVILAEIIGPESIRRFGRELLADKTTTSIKEISEIPFEILDNDNFFNEKFSKSPKLKFIFNTFRSIAAAIYFIASISILYFSIQIFAEINIILALILSFASIFVFAFLVLSAIYAAQKIIYHSLNFINSFLLIPVAKILENKSIDKILKFFSLILLLIGFHFDFLSS